MPDTCSCVEYFSTIKLTQSSTTPIPGGSLFSYHPDHYFSLDKHILY